MRILVLWAHESSPNLGVAVLARGSVDLLRRVWPDAEITLVNYGSRPPELPFGRLRSLAKERLLGRLGMQAWLREFDLVWDTRSGDSFADIYGLHRHAVMSAVYRLATGAGAIGVLAPQTIGPFESRTGRILARSTLRRSSSVFARDPHSAEVAETLGRPTDLTVSDLVFAIADPPAAPERDILLNVSGLLWNVNSHVDHFAYRQNMRDLAVRLSAAGRRVALLAHVLDSPDADNDVPAVQALAERLEQDSEIRLEVVVPADLDAARAAIAASRLVIASRMHACLNAISTGVPAIPLAYSRKFAPLLESIGWTHGFDLRTDDNVVDGVLALADRAEAVAEAEHARNRGRAAIDELASFLGASMVGVR